MRYRHLQLHHVSCTFNHEHPELHGVQGVPSSNLGAPTNKSNDLRDGRISQLRYGVPNAVPIAAFLSESRCLMGRQRADSTSMARCRRPSVSAALRVPTRNRIRRPGKVVYGRRSERRRTRMARRPETPCGRRFDRRESRRRAVRSSGTLTCTAPAKFSSVPRRTFGSQRAIDPMSVRYRSQASASSS